MFGIQDRAAEWTSVGRLIQRVAAQVGILLAQISKSGGISPRLVDSRIRAGLQELLVEGLLAMGPSSISSLAEWVRDQRGKSSRDTIKKRLDELVGLTIAVRDISAGSYALSRGFLSSYVRLLFGSPELAAELLETGWGR